VIFIPPQTEILATPLAQSRTWELSTTIDVINVYNVYKKILCKRVYDFVNVYLNKNYMSETKQNYDRKPSYSALRSNRSLIEFIGSRCYRASGGKQLPHDGAPPTEQTSRLKDV